jgi:DNA-binding response OmpR family regulator
MKREDFMKILGNYNLLLVEDDIEIRNNFYLVLEGYFGKIYEAENGKDALEIYKNSSIDIVITDYLMPYLDGPKLIEEIRKENRDIPIVIFSNHSEREMLMRCIPLNLLGYLTKPVDFFSLESFIIDKVAPVLKKNCGVFRLGSSVVFDSLTNSLCIDDYTYTLTRLESSLLKLLFSHQGSILSCETIERSIYSDDVYVNSGVKNLVYRIKKKYNFHFIENIKDMGYRIRIDES